MKKGLSKHREEERERKKMQKLNHENISETGEKKRNQYHDLEKSIEIKYDIPQCV